MRSYMSIYGLYCLDVGVFDNMSLPSGVEKDLLIDNLVLELCDMELLYPSFDIMKSAIGFWSKKEKNVWEDLVKTTQLEYNPIWNYDRTEEHEDTETRDLRGTDNETRDLIVRDNEDRNLTSNVNQTVTRNNILNNTGTDTTTDYNTGFNESDASIYKKNEATLGTNATSNGSDGTIGTVGDNGTIDRTHDDTGTIDRDKSDTGTVTNKRQHRAFGNIGVTSTQQLITAEREVVKFNIYDYIIQSFKERFCVLVYNK